MQKHMQNAHVFQVTLHTITDRCT